MHPRRTSTCRSGGDTLPLDTITALRTDQALVLALSSATSYATGDELTDALLRLTTDPPAASLVVLDVREIRVLPAQVARTLVAFAHTGDARGHRCVVLHSPDAAVARRALDAADPAGTVPRAATLRDALTDSDVSGPGRAAGPADDRDELPRPLEQVIEVTGVDAARELMSGTYARLRIQADAVPARLRIASAPLGPLRIDRTIFRMTYRAAVDPLRAYVLGQLKSGRLSLDSGGEHRDHRSGELYLAAQPEHDYAATASDVDVALAVFDPAVLDQLAQTAPGHRGPVRFTGYTAISDRAAAAWSATYDHLHDTILANPDMMAHPLVASNAARFLMATTLAAFPNTALTDPTIEDRHDAHPDTLRRAVAFIESHAERDITVADIAAAAHVTVRTVQLAFRRHLGTTPMAYLRRVRLDCAHTDLRAATAGLDTVTAIAARWGYGNPSVFAAHYRASFGEPPSYTLHNR
ncbi:helix-turn-helix domain-containing protein [Amycolatopsis vancoresmycina]|uniref:AraC family transcriptional regulator n=1 Tax=Amycolatopsis vancoresmycina DSM 44592 TaxID=1292037 RepID=R1IDD7_9PSEU|nr:helix-turn-helix domain-containing protein [Amycolatopsis vancoresmycina]EOD70491.1 AraC family transcriptional regulator [Amycolatopsis vancoresmycina DSM 44592]